MGGSVLALKVFATEGEVHNGVLIKMIYSVIEGIFPPTEALRYVWGYKSSLVFCGISL